MFFRFVRASLRSSLRMPFSPTLTSSLKNSKKTALPLSICLTSALIASTSLTYTPQAALAISKNNSPSNAPASNNANPNCIPDTKRTFSLFEIAQQTYPTHYKQMLAVYDALGLTSILEYRLSQTKSLSEGFEVLNKSFQELLLRPKGVERYQLNDTDYLAQLKNRLQKIYQAHPAISKLYPDAEKLRKLYLDPSLWFDAQPLNQVQFDMALLFGCNTSTYQARQDFFFELLGNKQLRLKTDTRNQFPVYLLGGARKLDASDEPLRSQLPPNSDEQDMMNMLFDLANKQRDFRYSPSSRVQLVPTATNSPKEGDSRPTTAGTLKSLIDLKILNNQSAILTISSDPFTRYQHLVTYRMLLQYGLDLKKIKLITKGPTIESQLRKDLKFSHALIAICSDNLAREFYEIFTIQKLENNLQCAIKADSKNKLK